jgi:uncharacterized protein YndB with AHSA1/START domain
MTANRIEKQVQLRAPRKRVWQAVSNAREFGSWFGVDFDGPFRPGSRLIGKIVPTTVDPEVAKLQKPHEGKAFEIEVESVVPREEVSFRWHPFAVQADVDYSKEPMTLVEFKLQEAQEGTRLTLTESGFDRIPEARRADAFAANEGGWEKQMELIQKYLEIQDEDKKTSSH